jgi:hypothetical protein
MAKRSSNNQVKRSAKSQLFRSDENVATGMKRMMVMLLDLQDEVANLRQDIRILQAEVPVQLKDN